MIRLYFSHFMLKQKLSIFNAGAIAASFGSVSAVTFVTAVFYLESPQLVLHGHVVAIMALMESPAIIIGLLLISYFNKEEEQKVKKTFSAFIFHTGTPIFVPAFENVIYTAFQSEGWNEQERKIILWFVLPNLNLNSNALSTRIPKSYCS